MTKKQQFKARIVWILLAILLGATCYIQKQPLVVLSSSFIGWCGGIAFVFAWLIRTEKEV